MAQYLNIEEKHRREGGFISDPSDFTTSKGEVVDSELVLHNPNTSLYCFDDEAQQAIFAELPLDVDLATAPFVYATQYEEAQRLIAVPYDEFRKLAQTLPPVDNLIMMYISGRSGSTLVSHILNEFDDVMSLSEPDVITQFIHLRDTDRKRDVELREFADCTVRMLFKPNPYKQPTTYALKFRMETLRAMDLFQETFPQAKNLYLYRDVAGFVRSFYRIFKSQNTPEYGSTSEFISVFNAFFNYDITPKMSYIDPPAEQISIVQYLTLWWCIGLEWYLEQANKGILVLPINYKDLKTSREKVLATIFDYCGLPSERATQPFRAFEHDSQAGSMLARDNPQEGNKIELTDTQQQDMIRIVERHPIIKSLDYIVPNTLQV